MIECINSCVGMSLGPTAVLPDYHVLTAMLILYPMCVSIGIVANTLAAVILILRNRSVPEYIYMFMLSLINIIFLMTNMFTFWTTKILGLYMLLNGDTYANSIWRLMLSATRTSAVWIIISLVLQRFLFVVLPPRCFRFYSTQSAWVISGIVISLVFIFSFAWFSAFSYVEICDCSKRTEEGYSTHFVCNPNKTYYTLNIIETTLLSSVPCVSFILSIVVMRITVTRRRKLSAKVGFLKDVEEGEEVDLDQQFVVQRQQKLTRRLVITFLLIFLFSLPLLVVVFIRAISNVRGSLAYTKGALANTYHIAHLLFSVNFGSITMIHCLMTKTFRNGLKCIILCKWSRLRKKAKLSNDIAH